MGNLLGDLCIFMIVSHRIILRMRNIWDRSCRENPNTHWWSDIFMRFCCSWDNVEKCSRPKQATDKYNMAHVLCMLNNWGYRHPLEYVVLIGFLQQQLLCECTSLLLYTYIACLVCYDTMWAVYLAYGDSVFIGNIGSYLCSSTNQLHICLCNVAEQCALQWQTYEVMCQLNNIK
jgi:hypothetical protein